MKSIVISINPEHALNILKGDKTRELRKSVPKGFVGWVYGYVTKGKPYLYNAFGRLGLSNIIHNELDFLNGTIPCRFWFEEYISYKYYADDNTYFVKRPQDFGYGAEGVLKSLCLTRDEFKEYGQGKDLYAWHIKKLEIFDKPMELGEFYTWDIKRWHEDGSGLFTHWKQVKHPPQSYHYVYVKGE